MKHKEIVKTRGQKTVKDRGKLFGKTTKTNRCKTEQLVLWVFG